MRFTTSLKNRVHKSWIQIFYITTEDMTECVWQLVLKILDVHHDFVLIYALLYALYVTYHSLSVTAPAHSSQRQCRKQQGRKKSKFVNIVLDRQFTNLARNLTNNLPENCNILGNTFYFLVKCNISHYFSES